MTRILIIESAGSGSGFPLDGHVTGLAFAFARQRLLSSYSGPLYRVRRDSDNTEQDIAAATNGDDVPSLKTFVGTNSAYLTKWYDQSGNGHDLVQATTTKQPKVVEAGAVFTNFQPDNIDDFVAGTVPSYAGGLTTYVAGQTAPVAGTGNPIIYNVGGTKSQIYAYAATSIVHTILVATGNGVTTDNGEADFGRSWATDLTQGGFNNQNNARAGQAFVGPTSFVNNWDANPFDAGALTVFANNAGTANFSPARIRVFIGYNAVHNNATADTISLNMQAYPSQDTGVLGKFINGMWLCCGLKRYLSGYTGNLINVRRDSDNTTQDIGYVSGTGLLDTIALAAFVGSANGFVTIWYDQSGNGNNVTQATASKQPKIVNAGTYLTDIEFDGVNDIMSYATPACGALSIAMRNTVRTLAGAAFQPIINSTVNGSTGQLSYYVQYQTGDGHQALYLFDTGTTFQQSESSQATTEQVNIYCMMGTPGLVVKRFINGSYNQVAQTNTGVPVGAFFASIATIGGSEVNSGWSSVSFKSLVIWQADQEGMVSQINALL